MQNEIKIPTVHLFPLLDEMLTDILESLTDEEWNKPTVAKLWTVKDVAAHLLDGNLRALSFSRDGYFGEKQDNINSYTTLVDYLNNLNLKWTDAAKRLSPAVITWLLKLTGKEFCSHIATLNPFDNAVFSVAWAGHTTSPNWFHIAREYTEKFLHQQQIRDAVGKPGLLTAKLSVPFFATFMYALPYTFKNVQADEGTTVVVEITTEAGGRWGITKKTTGWVLNNDITGNETAVVKISPDAAWKLFSKSLRPTDVMDKVEIQGDKTLGLQVLELVAVMA